MYQVNCLQCKTKIYVDRLYPIQIKYKNDNIELLVACSLCSNKMLSLFKNLEETKYNENDLSLFLSYINLWKTNKNINPKTGRKIALKHKNVSKECEETYTKYKRIIKIHDEWKTNPKILKDLEYLKDEYITVTEQNKKLLHQYRLIQGQITEIRSRDEQERLAEWERDRKDRRWKEELEEELQDMKREEYKKNPPYYNHSGIDFTCKTCKSKCMSILWSYPAATTRGTVICSNCGWKIDGIKVSYSSYHLCSLCNQRICAGSNGTTIFNYKLYHSICKDITEIIEGKMGQLTLINHLFQLFDLRDVYLNFICSTFSIFYFANTRVREFLNIKNTISTEDRIIFLDVPDQEKDEAASLGAIWDPNIKKWYYLSSQRAHLFSKWPITDIRKI